MTTLLHVLWGHRLSPVVVSSNHCWRGDWRLVAGTDVLRYSEGHDL